MKKSFLLGIALCLATVAFAQRSMEWYSYWGSNESGNQIDPQRMVVDNDGNIYVAALFGGAKVSVESAKLVSNSAADKGDAVIVKMSPSKVVLWTYSVVNAGNATVADIALDHQGNLIVVGAFNNSIKGASSPMALDDSNLGEAAIYVLKLSSAGNALATWQIPAMGATASSVVVDSQDNIIIAGLLDGDATFISGGDAEGDFQNTAQLFIAKYNNAGTHLWHQFRNDAGASVYTRPYLAVDASDNIYLAAGLNGSTTLAGQAVNTASVNNAFLLALNAAGTEQWVHMINGDASDAAAAIAVSPIGQVAIAVNHHSGELHIDDMSDVFNNGYAFNVEFQHTGIFAFDLNGSFKWFYDWGYSNYNADLSKAGADAICYSLRCTEEGVWYVAGMMTGRYGGSRLPDEIKTLPNGKNSGVETIDNQWMQHNTNGGHDCFLLTLTRDGKLANAIRPGGPQYEDGMDMALSPDKKSIYFLQSINVRNNVPYTCPDNIFDSWTDLYAPTAWTSRKTNYTLLNVFCPENDGTSTNYTEAYKGIFASSLLVKYSLPEINPNILPAFAVGTPYSQALSIVAAQGQAKLFPLEQSADVEFDGTTVSGTFDTDADRFVGVLAVDSTALPGDIQYYEYDKDLKRSIRSNPRAVRYMPLTIHNTQGIEQTAEEQNKMVGRKFIQGGILYIERNGKRYTAQGTEVK